MPKTNDASGDSQMSDRLVDSAYVRVLFGNRASIWMNRAKKSGLLPPPTRTINGRDYWLMSVVHEIAGVPVPTAHGEASAA